MKSLFILLTMMVAAMGEALVHETPSSIIAGGESGLARPEGIAFSPSGDILAAANKGAHIVTCYRRLSELAYEVKPFLTLCSALYHYPHDVAFSPDGTLLAIACTDANRIFIHKRTTDGLSFEPEPAILIEGSIGKLQSAHAVKFSPDGNILAVADVLGNQIALYHYQDDLFDEIPYQCLQGSSEWLNKPDGVAFSSRGELLAVTSHGVNKVLIFQRLLGSEQYSEAPVEVLEGEGTNFNYPHSLCFHPSDQFLVVSNASGKQDLNLFRRISDSVPRYSHTPIQTVGVYNPIEADIQAQYPEEGGVKGVAFTADGRYLGICASDLLNVDRALIIYPFRDE